MLTFIQYVFLIFTIVLILRHIIRRNREIIIGKIKFC